ncbi:hypothetical protein BEH_07265 [Priestia filamentosa]|uniref:Uncharacterized protein n=1 Tax=Priestia filamentosa TaxID=1402861 RepID=A0A0H4KUE3_9BACI|nr:hypothetical protein [Priestia filamentosa]AKO91918.1 hypothetical protein BEH_07265 [Priestia filamentosa]
MKNVNCSKCNQSLPFNADYFTSDKNRRFGLRRICLNCNTVRRNIGKYKNKYGIILNEDYFKTYSPIEWWKFIYYGTPNGKNLSRLPDEINIKDNMRELVDYVAFNVIGIKDINELSTNLIKDYKLTCIYKHSGSLLEFIKNFYSDKDTAILRKRCMGTAFWKEEEIERVMEAVLMKYPIQDILNSQISLSNIQKEYKLDSLVNKFGDMRKLLIWFLNKKEITTSECDFKVKKGNYWKVKANVDREMKQYIDSLLPSLESPKQQLPALFTCDALRDNGKISLYNCIYRHKHYNSFSEWINGLFPNFNLEEKDFKTFFGADGVTKCDSFQEKEVFDFLYSDLNLKSIQGIGSKRKKIFYNNEHKEWYCPDFFLDNKDFPLLDKPLYIEFYGLYHEEYDDDLVKTYVRKTKRKSHYYQSNPDIHYIGIYPEDLKDKYEGVRNKLTSFFMSKCNLSLPIRR